MKLSVCHHALAQQIHNSLLWITIKRSAKLIELLNHLGVKLIVLPLHYVGLLHLSVAQDAVAHLCYLPDS